LRAFAPTVIQAHYLSKFDRGLRELKRAAGARRLVVTDRSSGAASVKSWPMRVLSQARGWWVGTYIDRIVAVSEFVRRRDADAVHFPAGRIRVVHNGVDTTRFTPAAAPANDVFTIAYAGQLMPEKGVMTLLRAVRVLHESGLAVRLRVAGRGPQAGELERFAAAAGLQDRVEFLGQVDGVEQLFRSADVVVVPSEWEEAFGFVAAAAAACGACLAVSRAGALPEIVGSDGEAGLIFRKGDAADLARRLADLAADPARRERMRQRARALAVGCFSIERMVDGYREFFDEIDASLRRRPAAPPADKGRRPATQLGLSGTGP